LSAVVGDAVRSAFQRTDGQQDGERRELFGSGGLRPGVDLDDSASLLELMERDT
jgi:hypothetical protein